MTPKLLNIRTPNATTAARHVSIPDVANIDEYPDNTALTKKPVANMRISKSPSSDAFSPPRKCPRRQETHRQIAATMLGTAKAHSGRRGPRSSSEMRYTLAGLLPGRLGISNTREPLQQERSLIGGFDFDFNAP